MTEDKFLPQSSQIWNQDPKHHGQPSAWRKCCFPRSLIPEAVQDCRLPLEDWHPPHDDGQSETKTMR